ncbi:Hypothetical protein PENO1_021550 [Penicillium occitanis (nom. inval.)]|nr:Hypothetical protein PENO1_021550 [Penicillium occitanis (nom. inval.)]PCH06216.1 hypothetical protein PENOC_024930 [Penicillium occitanis (nom. inval.)]
MSETTITPDQDIAQSVRELTAKVQELCNILTPETPDKSRAALKAKDAVSITIHEQVKNGRPEKILDWEKVELLPVEEIEKEDKQYTQKYEDFWKEIDESTPSEKETATQAYTSAFTRFAEIYHLLGWQGTGDVEDPMFDEPILTESRDLLLESIFSIEAYQMSSYRELSERSRVLFETSRLPRLLVVLVRIAYRQVRVIGCGVDKPIKKRPFDARTVIKVLALVARAVKGGHLASSLSLEKILRSCYERRLLAQPDVSDVETYTKQFDLIYDCVTALDFTRRYGIIRDPLCALFYMRHGSESIKQLFERIKINHDAARGIKRYELPLTECTESTFRPEIFSVQYLQDFGQLRIEWTDCLDEHLKIYTHRNAIKIFAHPTFFYNAIDLHRPERDYTQPT